MSEIAIEDFAFNTGAGEGGISNHLFRMVSALEKLKIQMTYWRKEGL
jgi:hypothetical protein